MHGGYAPHVGADNHSFTTGRYSKFLPSQMSELYEDAVWNPELLDMSDNIALLEARIQTLLNEFADDQPVPRWSAIKELFDQFTTDLLGTDREKAIKALQAINAQLIAGMRWDTTWDQVTGTMEQLRKVADTEIKRKKELNMMVPIERVVILMAAVAHAVKRNVRDPEEIKAVLNELSTLHSTDRVPGNGMQRVGPEVVDVSPATLGVKGGRSREAKRRKRNKERDAEKAAQASQ